MIVFFARFLPSASLVQTFRPDRRLDYQYYAQTHSLTRIRVVHCHMFHLKDAASWMLHRPECSFPEVPYLHLDRGFEESLLRETCQLSCQMDLQR